ncbi:polysaccharide deacetylase family protein [Alkaliphilus serpentinus]|uniref:Polysaccharide deacetylase family protein n=1 Tax=Alkaliphilus serpentinus TaxID=1482731 RepID=A0A833MA16_9FIRM|nr:polysaccharide deacetylase family protein [Alkaliphilus serpentinus]KAB3529863.1 polysaccharide deacetylase family protein [Alkaliphilus serpentinus]
MKKFIKILITSILIVTLLGGCSKPMIADEIESKDSGEIADPITEPINEEKDPIEAPVEELPEEDPGVEEIDLNVVKPNEAGEIMVLMYHHIREPEAEWARTPDNFRRDLQELYDRGYRPISLYDYATGNITTEAGFTPVVFTFDDGNQNNFNMLQDDNGEWYIDPDSAVGVLVDFHEKNPDFPLEATFFINGGVPFGQKELIEYKLKYIVDSGMDIGNHTMTHINFTNATPEKIQEEMGRLIKFVKGYLPDYEIKTLALPFGSKPKNPDWLGYLVSGKYEDVEYNHAAVLEVGWDPYNSPFHTNFTPSKIRRVRASETKVDGIGMYDWMGAFDKGSRVRYISDGNPDMVTILEKDADKLREDLGDREIREYRIE